MAMDATCQIRMDSDLKAQVEELYRNLGTSFSEAVRILPSRVSERGVCRFFLRLNRGTI